jgi:hypothetical protein
VPWNLDTHEDRTHNGVNILRSTSCRQLTAASNINTVKKPVSRGQEVIIGTKKKGPYKTGDLIKEVQVIWNFLWQNKKKVTYFKRWILNRGDRMGRFHRHDITEILLKVALNIINPNTNPLFQKCVLHTIIGKYPSRYSQICPCGHLY